MVKQNTTKFFWLGRGSWVWPQGLNPDSAIFFPTRHNPYIGYGVDNVVYKFEGGYWGQKGGAWFLYAHPKNLFKLIFEKRKLEFGSPFWHIS